MSSYKRGPQKFPEPKPFNFFFTQTVLKSEKIYMMYVKITVTYPFSQVVGQNEISGEGVWKGCVELQHFLQGIPLNHMQITVSQSPHISTGLGESRLLPEHITKNVSFAYRKSTALLSKQHYFHQKYKRTGISFRQSSFFYFCAQEKKLSGKKKTTQLWNI